MEYFMNIYLLIQHQRALVMVCDSLTQSFYNFVPPQKKKIGKASSGSLPENGTRAGF
jgi:hypothetical protein